MRRNWLEFYKNENIPKTPTSFAQFVLPFFKGQTIADLGCGNKRDTEYFRHHGYTVHPVDPYSIEDDVIKVYSSDYNLTEDIVYSRFFLHSISNNEIIDILDRTPNMFCAETRVEGDTPLIYKHERNLINPEWLLQIMLTLGYNISYVHIGRGLAPYKNEDPLVLRVIGEKC